MNNVATLIVKTECAGPLDQGLAIARQLIETAGASIEGIDWLSPNQAVDLFFDAASPAEINPILVDAMHQIEIDCFAQAASERKARMLIADMDSTIINIECIDELAEAMGVKDQIAPITAAAMRGEIDFSKALKARVQLLEGLSLEQLDEIRRERLGFSPGARALVATMREAGAGTLLLSGGFTHFSDCVAKELGFDEARANQLEIENGRLTGQLLPPFLTASSKCEALIETRDGAGVPKERTLAIGDGANDIPMIREAGTGIAYHAKAATAAAADARIEFAGLEAALFYQGYHRSDFISGQA